MTAVLLEVSGVTLQYKTPRHLVTATYKVDFAVHQGDRYVILGPSGCGKSTLLKAVGGFMPPVEGSIRIRGHEVDSPGPDRMMVFQEFEQLMPWKTVYQNVLFPMKVTKKFTLEEAKARARAVIEKVKLTDFQDVYPHMLSCAHNATVHRPAPDRSTESRDARSSPDASACGCSWRPHSASDTRSCAGMA